MSIINFARNILLSNFRRCSYPYKLTLALTYRCNSRCKLCQIWKKKPERELTLQELKRFFANNKHFNWIDLTGGEIFLLDNLPEIVKVIFQTQRELCLLHVPTNGLMPKKIFRDVKTILSFKPKKFLISIAMDGPEPVHNDLRGIKNNWGKAIETYQALKKLKSRNFDCYFGMTLSKYNHNLVEETYLKLKEKIKGLKRSDVHFNIAHHSEHYYDNKGVDLAVKNDFLSCLEAFNKRKRYKVSVVQLLENVYQNLISVYLKTGKSPVSCQALSASIFIDPRGNVYPCGMWDRKVGELKKCDFNLNYLWNKKKTEGVYYKIKQGNCPGCWTPCEAYQSILGSSLLNFRQILLAMFKKRS